MFVDMPVKATLGATLGTTLTEVTEMATGAEVVVRPVLSVALAVIV
jgi:hypothetical protein